VVERLAHEQLVRENARTAISTLDVTVECDLDADVTFLRTTGCLDLGTAVVMRDVLARSVAQCPLSIVVDVAACAAGAPAALSLFPSAARTAPHRPAVAILLCGADDRFLADGGTAALGPVPRYPTRADALRAAEMSRAAQRRVVLGGAPSVGLPGQAREAVSTACDRWGVPDLRAAATLIISELVTNAVRHADGDIVVEAMPRGDFLHLRVRDTSPVPPRARTGSPEPTMAGAADGGRGLPIVSHYSSAWGWLANAGGGGKVVWASLRARPPRARPLRARPLRARS
jgi:anti-sigma regulatory factor (Ser/Thr protein kinase)